MTPKLYTDAIAALKKAEELQGIVYQFGSIYKVYWGNMSLPNHLTPYWIGALSNDLLNNYLTTL